MIDIVSVFYDNELPQQVLQARSIRRYFDTASINEIVLIYNDDKNRKLPEIIAERLREELAGLPVTLLNRAELADLTGFHGWVSQQVLKLLVAKILTAEDYLVLDAKNHFIAPVDHTSFVAEDGRFRACLRGGRGTGEAYFRGSFAYFGLDADAFIDGTIANVTPFMIRRQVAVDLIGHIERAEGTPFQTFFRGRQDMCEFYLLIAFMIFSGRALDDIYAADRAIALTIWESLVGSTEFDAELALAHSRHYVVFGVQKWAVGALSQIQRAQIGRLWVAASLVSSLAEADDFLQFGPQGLKMFDQPMRIGTPDNARICNICGSDNFVHGTLARGAGPPRQCAQCRSVERHRAIRTLYAHLLPILQNWRALQYAPDRSVEAAWFSHYISSIVSDPQRIRVLETGLDDGAFDIIIANHVLNFVANDIAALREWLRVVGPRGLIHVCVPSPIYRWQTESLAPPAAGEISQRRRYGSDFPLAICRAVPGTLCLSAVGIDPVSMAAEIVYFFSASASRLQLVGSHLQRAGVAVSRYW